MEAIIISGMRLTGEAVSSVANVLPQVGRAFSDEAAQTRYYYRRGKKKGLRQKKKEENLSAIPQCVLHPLLALSLLAAST